MGKLFLLTKKKIITKIKSFVTASNNKKQLIEKIEIL
jgi:hypothetical protein